MRQIGQEENTLLVLTLFKNSHVDHKKQNQSYLSSTLIQIYFLIQRLSILSRISYCLIVILPVW